MPHTNNYPFGINKLFLFLYFIRYTIRIILAYKIKFDQKGNYFYVVLQYIIFQTINNVHNKLPRHKTDTQRFIMHTYVFHAIKVESKCKGKFLSSRVDFNLNGSNWFVFASLFEFRFNPFLGTIFSCR